MKRLANSLFLTSLFLSPSLLAGDAPRIIIDDKKWGNEKQSPKILDFSFDARVRYEFREEGNLDASHAGTVRLRPGLTFLPDGPFSVFVEGEFTSALLDDFQSGPSPDLEPFTPGNTPIFDPETAELNQAYAQYKKNGFQIRVGRQRYILDNSAFVGNLVWRQNEQTLDAATLSYTGDDYSISYAYANQVNRIFGSDANGLLRELEGDIHLLNGWKKFGDLKVGGYAYLIDFDEAPNNAFLNRASSNTFGGYVKYQGWHAEFAFQTDGDSSNLNRNESIYAHVYYGTTAGNFKLKAGLEHLEEDFYTPLSTVHLFNGFADNFIASRLGIADNPGINDLYVMAGTEVADVHLKGFAHYYTNDSVSQDFGWELDFVAHKQLSEGVHLITKLAYYNGGGGGANDDNIKQASVQLDYSF